MALTLYFTLQREAEGLSDSTVSLGSVLLYDEWEALFYDALRCPTYWDETSPDEGHNDYQAKLRRTLAGYPMLSKLSDFFYGAWYAPEEINQLRDECLDVKASTSNQDALEGLNGLISACDEALILRLGISMVSD